MSRKNPSSPTKAVAPTEDPLSILLEETAPAGNASEPPQGDEFGDPNAAFTVEEIQSEVEERAPDALESAAAAPPRRRPSGNRAAVSAVPAGPLAPLGWLLVVAGVALSGLAAFGSVPALTELLGKGLLGGSALLAAGAVLITAASLARRQTEASHWLAQHQASLLDTVQSGVDELLAYQRAIAERPPKDDTEALDRATLAIQRQDEKLANLSKALKMYGKPLMDISQQTSEISQLVADLGQSVQATKTGQEQATRSLETVLRGQLDGLEARQTPQAQKLEDLATATRAQQQALITLQKDSREGIQRHTSLERMLDELKKQVLAASERLEKHDDTKAVTQIAAQVESARDAILAQLKRDIATLQTQLSRVQAVAANVQAASVAAPQAAAQPAPVAAAAAPASAEPAAEAPSAPAAASPEGLGPGGLAQSIAGEKKTQSKNVLGAIAKLKNMRK